MVVYEGGGSKRCYKRQTPEDHGHQRSLPRIHTGVDGGGDGSKDGEGSDRCSNCVVGRMKDVGDFNP